MYLGLRRMLAQALEARRCATGIGDGKVDAAITQMASDRLSGDTKTDHQGRSFGRHRRGRCLRGDREGHRECVLSEP